MINTFFGHTFSIVMCKASMSSGRICLESRFGSRIQSFKVVIISWAREKGCRDFLYISKIMNYLHYNF